MKINSTKKIFGLHLLLVVLLVALHVLVFVFIQNASKEVTTLEQEISVLEAQVAEFSKHSSDDLRNLAQSVMSRFVSKSDFVSFIEGIEREAKAQNVLVTIRSVGAEPRSDDPNDDKEIIKLQLESKGSWGNTLNFLNYLEHLPYKIDLRQIGLSVVAGDGRTKVPQWQSQIEITALKFK